MRASWLEQLLTKAFCPAWRLSVPPGVLRASEVDLEPVGDTSVGAPSKRRENGSPTAEILG